MMLKTQAMHRFLLALLGVFILLFSLQSCKKENDPIVEEEPEPFVRLVQNQKFTSKAMSFDINYQVLLPAEYENSTDSFPVVYLLHGLGDDETAWTVGGLLQYHVDKYASTSIPMIYVMPTGFRSYYVNRYNNPKNYMYMFTNELVPLIDSLYRTKSNAQNRAVMGYSMGGYGAFILPVKNPDVFRTGVALSMSFRTNEQYLNESQSVYDYQWSPIFGGSGATGEDRFTDYYKQYSPFQFLLNPDDQSLLGLNLLFDCGDDEESLSVTNNELHQMLNDRAIPHEFRMRSGYHSWDYWRKSLPEALKYISYSVQQIPWLDESEPAEVGNLVADEKIIQDTVIDFHLDYRVVLPENYQTTTVDYPVILIFHQVDDNLGASSKNLLSLMVNQMTNSKLSPSILVEIPVAEASLPVQTEAAQALILLLKNDFRVANDREKWVIMGNRSGGRMCFDLFGSLSDQFQTCLLFDANLSETSSTQNTNQIYYLDICDKGVNYQVFNQLYLKLRKNEIPHEYRIRQGMATHNDFLLGVEESISFINNQIH